MPLYFGTSPQNRSLWEDLALAFLFDALDEFVEDPGAGDELGVDVSI
jgi:hypothetical protein